jgi:hypothetical protein
MGNLFAGFLFFVLLPLVLLLCGLALAALGVSLLGGGLLWRPASGTTPQAGAATAAPRAGSRNPFLALGGGALAVVGVLLLIPGVVCGVVGVKAVLKDQGLEESKSDARSELQALLGAERSYRRANGGFYDRPECLARPSSCIPGYGGSPFLDEKAAALAPRDGYTFRFHPGTAAPAEAVRAATLSPSSLEGYALVAIAGPDLPNAYHLCVDARGLVCHVDEKGAGEGGVCACWAPVARAHPQVIEFVHEAGTSHCPQLVGQLEVYNELERDIVTDVRTVGAAPLSFGPNLTLRRREGGAVDVFFTCGGRDSFTAEVTGLKPEDVRANPDTAPTYPSQVTVKGTIAR